MSSLTVRLHDQDRSRIVTEIIEGVATRILDELKPHLGTGGDRVETAPGIQVLTKEEVADRMGVSPRHLPRLEAMAELPRRRQITKRRVGYLLHEIERAPAELLPETHDRRLSLEQLAQKLGVHPKTVARMEDLPPREQDGEWSERKIDGWLLTRPHA